MTGRSRIARRLYHALAPTVAAAAMWASLGEPMRAQDGKAAYTRACASCHGDDAGGRLAPALVPFTRGSQDFLRIVRNGSGGMMTGVAAADVSDADVRAIESFLRSLPAPAAAGSSGASALPAAAAAPVAGAATAAIVRGQPVTFGTSAVRVTDRPAPAGSPERMVEWSMVGGDPGNARYSPLTDINLANVNRLTVAWRWRPEERPLPEYNVVPGNFTSTPIMIDNVVYVSTNYNRVAALDADTGAVKWVYDPRAYEGGMPLLAGGFRHRGVAAWRDRDNGNALRILLASRYRLISLDAATGEPVASFGSNGVVDTSRDLSWSIDPAHFEMNAAPTVYQDLVILGSAIGDNLLYRKTPPGDVRAYHARTGALVWRWSSIPQSPTDVGADTWVDGAWRDAGQIETWPGVTVDQARGLVYLPTGNPGNLYYGGARPGHNLFAETLIALDAATGARQWHYQLVHHGVWDYSLPAQAMLMELTVDGRRIPAVTQLTKHGFVFAFDRVSGQPIWPLEERPVPQSDVPGEKSSPTQPFPTRPPPVSPQGVTLDDAFDVTPELKATAQAEMRKYRIGPLFTPPSVQGSLVRPGPGGTVSWGGGSFDPATGMLYVKTSNQFGNLRVQRYDPKTSRNTLARAADQFWIGYELVGASSSFNDGLPLNKPPYAELVAIDMNRGVEAWRVPFGFGEPTLRNHPALKGVALPDRLGTPGTPGSIVTAGGLVFAGGGDRALFAFDKQTGREVWNAPLPRRTSGTPMTYRSWRGRQFVLITTGSGTDQELVAYALSP